MRLACCSTVCVVSLCRDPVLDRTDQSKNKKLTLQKSRPRRVLGVACTIFSYLKWASVSKQRERKQEKDTGLSGVVWSSLVGGLHTAVWPGCCPCPPCSARTEEREETRRANVSLTRGKRAVNVFWGSPFIHHVYIPLILPTGHTRARWEAQWPYVSGLN